MSLYTITSSLSTLALIKSSTCFMCDPEEELHVVGSTQDVLMLRSYESAAPLARVETYKVQETLHDCSRSLTIFMDNSIPGSSSACCVQYQQDITTASV